MTSVKIVKRLDAQDGYDLWAQTYDETPNPVVHMDGRRTLAALAPCPGEAILDAGCGTGRNLAGMLAAGSRPTGVDFSPGMLSIARARAPGVPLLQANLEQPLPLAPGCFDAVLCALVGEHLSDLSAVFRSIHAVLRPGGRFVFSVYHPAMAARGAEAQFEREGVEYRLGAVQYTVADYLARLAAAGFTALEAQEYQGDAAMLAAVPRATKYLGFPVLLVVSMLKAQP
jgi:SAM-dependent methyltransferase